jgi:hypothetical protein
MAYCPRTAAPRDELWIISMSATDNFVLPKKDGTYSKLFEHVDLLIVNALTSVNAH